MREIHPDTVSHRRRRLAVVLGGGLLLGTVAAWILGASDAIHPGSAAAATEDLPRDTVQVSEPAATVAASATGATAQKPAAGAAEPAKAPPAGGTPPASAKPASSRGTASKAAAKRTASNSAQTVSIKPQVQGKTAGAARQQAPVGSPRDERVIYHYDALGRRDPFLPLIGGTFVGRDVGGAAPPDVGGLTVVGIVWGPQDQFALVEDPRGTSMVLRQGDKVMNGVVEKLKRDAMIVKLTVDGQTDLVSIPLARKGESHESH